MKLFIWYGVLTDCTSGMIVALAKDLQTARRATDMNGEPELSRHYYNPAVTLEMAAKEPDETVDLGAVHYFREMAVVWYVYGGA